MVSASIPHSDDVFSKCGQPPLPKLQSPGARQLLQMINLNRIAGQVRGMATLKDSKFSYEKLYFLVQNRLKAIKNIEKITKSMKMIASTKLNRAQKAMEIGKTYSQLSTGIYTHASLNIIYKEFLKQIEAKPRETAVAPLVVACSSDRGLCGAIHSSISKVARKEAKETPATQIAVLGDKAKPQIAREARKNIKVSFNQIGKAIPTFLEASSIANTILEQKLETDSVKVLYNRFISVIAYENTTLFVPSLDEILSSGDKLNAFEFEDDALENYVEFCFANCIYWGLIEGHAAEMAAKRTAMENASKNAGTTSHLMAYCIVGEIINVLTMKYNRTRQAVITNELVDIITGASAL